MACSSGGKSENEQLLLNADMRIGNTQACTGISNMQAADGNSQRSHVCACVLFSFPFFCVLFTYTSAFVFVPSYSNFLI